MHPVKNWGIFLEAFFEHGKSTLKGAQNLVSVNIVANGKIGRNAHTPAKI